LVGRLSGIQTQSGQTSWEECRPSPVFASHTLAFALQLRKKARKNLSQGRMLSFDSDVEVAEDRSLHGCEVVVGERFLTLKRTIVSSSSRGKVRNEGITFQ
jgi:hypothetical protein